MMTSADILRAVRGHYGQEAVVISEVADSVGATQRRRIDALALGCWPSRGLYVHAIEIKVSKSDLRRELDNPAKADRIARYADRFFLATPEGWGDIALPEPWGWYEVDNRIGGLTLRKPATQIEAEPLTRSFIMAIARSLATQAAPEAALEAARVAGANDEGRRREEETRRIYAENAAVRNEIASLRNAMRGIDTNALHQFRGIIHNLTGHYGSLNTIRIQAKNILEHAESIEEIARKVFPTEIPG